MNTTMRYYQTEADEAIFTLLIDEGRNDCLVKMFCGTGKSKVMTEGKVNRDCRLIAFVFPSLSLVEQFDSDYLSSIDSAKKIRICSDADDISTTSSEDIDAFLRKTKKMRTKVPNVILVTYQSLSTLIDALRESDVTVDRAHFDEAHRCTATTYKSLIFGPVGAQQLFAKRIFYTATPHNKNGVTMLERSDDLDSDLDSLTSDAPHGVDLDSVSSIGSDDSSGYASDFETNTQMSESSDSSVVLSCGKLAYEYGYYQGMLEGFLNPFDINIDFYAQNTNASIYESIARAILSTGNTRVLTFHADVHSGRDASVAIFANLVEFRAAYRKVWTEEFAENKWGLTEQTNLRMVGLHAGIPPKCNNCKALCRSNPFVPTNKVCCRFNVLRSMDATQDDAIMVVSSCQTIGEGVDTKFANMVVFVDPKTSIVAITQNLGRTVRKQVRKSTVLLPCWVDAAKYEDADTPEKRDAIIRQSMGKHGDFNSILNVMSAVKQESVEMHDLCLYYPNTFTNQEISGNLRKQNHRLAEQVGEGRLSETLEFCLGRPLSDPNPNEGTESEDEFQCAARNEGIVIEVHSSGIHDPVRTYYPGNGENGRENGREESEIPIVRLFQAANNDPIVPIVPTNSSIPKLDPDTTQKDKNPLSKPNVAHRMKYNCHSGKDTQVLWKIVDSDLSQRIGSCVIDCEIVSNEEQWFKNLEQLKTFMVKEKRTPKPISKDPTEKKLGSWLSNQKTKFNAELSKSKHIMKDPAIHKSWTDFISDPNYTEFFVSNEELWFKNLEQLKTFLVQEKRTPNSMSKDTTEKKLGGWLIHQKQIFKVELSESKYIMIVPAIHKSWSEFISDPNYTEFFVSNEELWFQSLEQLKTFLGQEKRTPIAKSKDTTEKKLGSWLGNQKTNFKADISESKHSMKFPAIHKSWSEFISDPNYTEFFVSNEEQWFKNLEQLKTFMVKEKRTPNKTSKDTTEKKLGSWLGTQKKNFNANISESKYIMKDPAIHKSWSEFISDPNYTEFFVSNEELWFQSLEQLKTFLVQEKRTPKPISKDTTEKKLGTWVGTQKTNFNDELSESKYIMNVPAIHKSWTDFISDPNYTEFLMSNEELWHQSLEQLKTFLVQENRTPIQKSKIPTEKKLGLWLGTQKQNFNVDISESKYIMKVLVIHKSWSEFISDPNYTEFFVSNEEQWFKTLEQLKTFLVKEKKTPKPISKYTTEKKLGSWLSNQKQNFNANISESKHIMKDPAIHKSWSEFISDPQYAPLLASKTRKEKEIPIVQGSTKTECPITPTQKTPYVPTSAKLQLAPERETPHNPVPVPDFAAASNQDKEMAFNAYHQSQNQHKSTQKGYQSTNLDDKDLLNQWFVRALPSLPENKPTIIVLDHTEFNSVRAVLDRFSPTTIDLVVPQYDQETYVQMSSHPQYGRHVVFATLETCLHQCLDRNVPIVGVYADLTCVIQNARTVLDDIRTLNLVPGAVIGITISQRNPDGVAYPNQDAGDLAIDMYERFAVSTNVIKENTGGNKVHVYGKMTRMATAMVTVK